MNRYKFLAWFLLVYTVFAAVLLSFNQPFQLLPIWALLPIFVMIYLIIEYQKHQDEVLKKINAMSYMIGFWLTLLGLLILETSVTASHPQLEQLPLWAIPLLAWNVGYVIAWFRHT